MESATPSMFHISLYITTLYPVVQGRNVSVFLYNLCFLTTHILFITKYHYILLQNIYQMYIFVSYDYPLIMSQVVSDAV
jgi:hypothetical protein